jgi:hypothetical protein
VLNQNDSDATNGVLSVCEITIRYYSCTVMVSDVEKLIAASVAATLNKDVNSGKLSESCTPFYTETLKLPRKFRVNQEGKGIVLFS